MAETLIFGGAALALHLVAWPADTPRGAESAGGGGADLVTMSAASAAVARAVAEWERPPAPAMDAPAAPAPPALPHSAAPSPIADTAPPRHAALPRSPTRPAALSPPPAIPKPPDRAPTARRVEAKPATPDTPRPPPRPARTPTKRNTDTPPPQAEPSPAPSRASAAQVARRAAGDGGTARGRAAPAQSATLSPARARNLMAEWGGQIRTRIARGVPRGAGSGTAVVRLTVSADGGLVAVGLAKSSGNPRIDALALQAVRRAGRFPAAPAQLGLSQQSFTLPVQSR
ncbi:energy transducer TonB [Rhodovulum sp. ES.010]|uniref:energy transducer TonB n=1 Tax=Rhodovulum sp. ES.010 TaxID=1882821 RepID=UPI000940BD66|nr:energy transducer TonB [Rhodovulum sp. ES.010]